MDDFVSNIPILNADLWVTKEELYKEQLEKLSNLSQIPLLNCTPSHNLSDGSLVRFRGMIQDMFNPEMYFKQLEITNSLTNEVTTKSGKYRDNCSLLQHEKVTNTEMRYASQRHPYVMVSFPGLNEWAQREEERQNRPNLDQPNTTKRLNTSFKRGHEECSDDDKMEVGDDADQNKEVKTCSDVEEKPLAVSREHLLNFPIPDVPCQACHVKIYKESELKLNDLVEVVGFLSVNPALSGEFHDRKNIFANLETEEEFITHNPPPSLIPRIHVVHYRKLRHCNPLIVDPVEEVALLSLKKARDTREHLFKILTELLFGDKLAAEFLICYLVSHVYLRQDSVTAGQCCLNIGNIPVDKYPDYVNEFYNVLKLILTQSYYLPFTVDNLNTLSFVPKKDMKCNRLTSGILQLSRGTYFIIDETKMSPGNLDASGLTNMSAIAKMISLQKVDYSYEYFIMNMDSDIPVLVLSEGKSLLPCDFFLPLQPEESTFPLFDATLLAVQHYLKEDILNDIRVYLTSLKFNTYNITEDIEYVENDYVEMRSVSKEMSEDELHKLLVLSRLLGLSKGNNTLTHECWNVAKRMERDRLQRVHERAASINEI